MVRTVVGVVRSPGTREDCRSSDISGMMHGGGVELFRIALDQNLTFRAAKPDTPRGGRALTGALAAAQNASLPAGLFDDVARSPRDRRRGRRGAVMRRDAAE